MDPEGAVSRRQQGITLIEVLVALLLLSLLSAGIVSVFRFCERAYWQLTRVDAAQRELVAAQRFLRTVLESAYPFNPPATSPATMTFAGGPESLTITAPSPLSDGARGHRRYELFLRTQPDSSQKLMVRSSLDRHGAFGPAREELLVEKIQSLSWTYLEDQASAAPRWLDRWNASPRLPRLVRLHVEFAAKDARVWPDLIVDPRITHAADCEFDIVAQSCRQAQL